MHCYHFHELNVALKKFSIKKLTTLIKIKILLLMEISHNLLNAHYPDNHYNPNENETVLV